ncbi:hypothetical protein ABPG72_004338 [Tetrahymena utriculariae]
MSNFKLRTSVSQQGERIRPFFSRQQPNRPVPQTSYNQKRSYNSKLEQPGLYFDINQAKDMVNFQNPLINRAQSQQQMRSISGFAFSEKSQKLYSPYEYLHYATKVNGSKEQYLNALQQLGYDQAEIFQNKPLNEIINNTNGIINRSYSVKYMGIIDGNMGILTNRKKIYNKSIQKPSQQFQKQLVEQETDKNKHQTNHFKYGISPSDASHDENSNRIYQYQASNQNEETGGGVQQVSLGDNRQSKIHLETNTEQQVSKPSEIVSQNQQIQLQQKPQKQYQIKEQKSSSQNKLQTVVTNPNLQSQTNYTQQADQIESQIQKIPHPENYSTYLVGKYALPRGLKSIKRMRDPAILQQKLKLEQWHAEKIKVFEVSEQQGGGFSIQNSNHNKSNSSSNYPHHQGQFGQTKSNFMKSSIHFSQQQKGNARMKSSLYKKPLQNYEENVEEGICYAIIDQNPNQDTVSFSKLLQHIDRVDPSQIINRILPKTQQNKSKQLPPGVIFEQNTQLFQRYQNLQTKTFIASSSPNKSLQSDQN